MDQMKQNGFWIVVGVLVVIAVGLTGYRLFGIGADIEASQGALQTAQSRMEADIIAKGESAPNSTWPDVYRDRVTKVNRVLKECYKEYGDTDDKIEMWVDETGKPKVATDPPGGPGPWKARYVDRGNSLKAELEKKGIKVGPEPRPGMGPGVGGPGAAPRRDEEGGLGFLDPNEMKADLKVYQKQWWIQERFVKAVLATPNVVRVEKVEFAAEAGTEVLPIPPSDGQPPAPTYHKPTPIKVKFTVQVMYGDVSKLVANLIKMDSELPIRFRKVDLRVVKLSMLDQKATDSDDLKEDVQKDQYKEETWKPSKDVSPMPVRVEVSAEALDFNIPAAVRQ